MPKDENAARARGVLKVKKTEKKCTHCKHLSV